MWQYLQVSQAPIALMRNIQMPIYSTSASYKSLEHEIHLQILSKNQTLIEQKIDGLFFNRKRGHQGRLSVWVYEGD